ncbi:MAG: transcription antitermination factor NusB, partial [Pseudomonadota bacterium]
MARNDNRPDPREIAHRLLRQVLAETRMLDDADLGAAPPEARARALALARTVLRHMGPLDQVITALTLRPPPLAAMNALRIAAAEMLIEGVPPHAAVSQAVALTRRAAPRLGGLVNAVGRKIAEATLPDTPQELPKPIRGAVRGAFGDDITRAIEAAHAARPPLDLSLRDPSDAVAWADRLGADVLPTGSLRLAAGAQISALPGYGDGAWWVQDAAAALPVTLLGDVAGQRVLDLCAAPGGKTLQLATRGADVTALDVSPGRLTRLRRNLKRTGLSARVVEADALTWAPEAPFDAIMIDAPCS